MPVNVTRTTRKVNTKTGIDMSVTGYDPASSARQVKDYHVVVITNLPHYKLPEHSEQDVVQFMVPRDYAAFEKFQKELMTSHPELKLPSLPRKYHVFMDDSDIEERQISFDCIMKVVAKNKEVATSIPVLQFLGFDPLADRKYFKARRKYLQEKEEKATKDKEKDERLFGGRTEQLDKGLFGSSEENGDVKNDATTKTSTSKPFEADSIFDDSGASKSKTKRSAKVTLLEEDEEADLFIPSGVKTEKKDTDEDLIKTEDNSEILNVSDTLDDVLHLAQKKPTKPTKKATLATTSTGSNKAGGLFDVDDSNTAASVGDMGKDDIMKYIQLNENTADDDDPELF